MALLLAAGLLETAAVWLPDQETSQLRELERTRQRLTQQTTRLGSYSGLVPRVSQSGERRWTGPLTKRGNRFLRWAMVLAAQHFSRVKATKNLSPGKWYYHLAFQHGPNVAKVALARRMLDIIFAMLRDGTEFDPTRLTGADTQS